LGTFLPSYLISFIPCETYSLASAKLYKKQNALPPLCFYTFIVLKPYAFIPNYLFTNPIFLPATVQLLQTALKPYGK